MRLITGRTRVAGVIGAPVAHSVSPAIFNAAFGARDLDWVYAAFPVAAGDAGRALDGMRALGLAGLSVTMPHKEDVARLVDRRSPDADALGAVNCVVADDGGLRGENTDGPGFVDALHHEVGFDPAGRTAVVIGAGGAARAVVLALARAGAREVVVLNRTEAKGQAAAALAGAAGRTGTALDVGGADLVVNATPIGMLDDALPPGAEHLEARQVVADLVYHPAETPLLAEARRRGAVGVNGLGMLVHQAGHAYRLWTGDEPPISVMLDAARAATSEMR